jgi:hypothetical protein
LESSCYLGSPRFRQPLMRLQMQTWRAGWSEGMPPWCGGTLWEMGEGTQENRREGTQEVPPREGTQETKGRFREGMQGAPGAELVLQRAYLRLAAPLRSPSLKQVLSRLIRNQHFCCRRVGVVVLRRACCSTSPCPVPCSCMCLGFSESRVWSDGLGLHVPACVWVSQVGLCVSSLILNPET